jgi:acetylornithine deacetylase ArgE
MTVENTLADLVAIDSVSTRSNAELVAYLQTRCEALGLKIKTYPHTDGNGIEKINLVARTSDDAALELALVGHTDTVPYDPNWNDALRLTEQDGKLFGRGSCDTKAFIAAALTAIENVDLAQLRKPMALVFTADEEIGCLGAKRLAKAKPFTARHAIVGEPTSLQPMRAGKGYCLAEVTLRGREAHSAYPQLGASAIFRAARLIDDPRESRDDCSTQAFAFALEPRRVVFAAANVLGSKDYVDQCLNSETSARDQLAQEWAEFAPADRASCLRSTTMTGGGNYSELHACLDLKRFARNMSKSAPAVRLAGQ